MSIEVRKTRGGEVEERTHHARGTRRVRTGPAGYGVFVDDRQVADIVGERSGFRGRTHWEIITTGYDDPRLNYRVLHRAPSLQAAKAWALENEQKFSPQKKTPAQLDAEIAEALAPRSSHATRTLFWDKSYAKVGDLVVGDVVLLGSVPPYTAHEVVGIEPAPRRRVRLHLERLPDRQHRSQSELRATATVGVPQAGNR
jgi:hypothetical protein